MQSLCVSRTWNPSEPQMEGESMSVLAVLKAVLVRGKCFFPLTGTCEFAAGALSLFWEPLSTGLTNIFVGTLGMKVAGVWKPQM